MPEIKSKSKQKAERPVKYPDYKEKRHTGEHALTVEQSKELLGWEEETDKVKFGSDYLLTDRHGKKVRCSNNVKNRPLYLSSVNTYVQEHLMRRWKYNAEPIIIGKTGLVLNGQHQLISHVLAEQERVGGFKGSKESHWASYWEAPITMEKLVAYGIEETDDVVNTMDTCKPRSLADVLYRSEHFARMSNEKRKVAARICDYAIRTLWARTGASKDPFAPRRTHAESLDFIARHGRLLKCVKHIMEEDQRKKVSETEEGETENSFPSGKKGNISSFIGPGYAAALMYMMACSKCDGDDYRLADVPSEKKLSWEMWETACAFWIDVGKSDPKVQRIRDAIASKTDPNTGEATASLGERIAIFIKGWLVYSAGNEITDEDLELQYSNPDDDGAVILIDPANLGGIDLGPGIKEAREAATAAEGGSEGEEEEAQREEEQTEEQAEEEARKKRIEHVNNIIARRKAKGQSVPAEPDQVVNSEKAPDSKPKRQTRSQVEKEQTERARRMDEEMKAESTANP